jgi:membrane protease subunit HflC
MSKGAGRGGVSGRSTWLIAGLIVLFTLSMMFYIVDETESVVVTQFGRPVKTIREPGLYVKLPEPVQTIKRFDDRLIVSESSESEVLTSDKKNLVVDYYVVWRIDDPLAFMQSVVNEKGANYRISDIVYSELRRQLGLNEFKDIISLKRDEINRRVVQASDDKVRMYGMRIIDVRLRRINFPYQNLAHVYDRMRSERAMIANRYRSEGEETALKVRAEADRMKTTILSQAYNNASKIIGGADAEATSIYGLAYAVDPEFYRFMRTLEAYNRILPNERNVLIMSSDSELFRYLGDKV